MSLKELRDQLSMVEAQIERVLAAERHAALTKIRSWMAEHCIDVVEIFADQHPSRTLPLGAAARAVCRRP